MWLLKEGQARLVAALGDAYSWPALREAAFLPHWPKGTKPQIEHPKPEEAASFCWTDADGDELPQPGEVKFVVGQLRGVTVMNDLAMVVARFGEEGARFAPRFDAAGLPGYDLERPESLGIAAGNPPSSGGDQSLTEPGGWTISTIAPKPYSPFGLGGKFKGDPRWSYPSPWPGLHPSHEAAVPDRPGEVVGTTRLLGGWVQGKAGPMFCVNGNMGNMYLFTADGLLVGTLFHDIRLRPKWAAPVPTRNMDVTDVSLHDENFWPSITQIPDGRVYLVDGGRTTLVRLDGLETLRRIEPTTITVSEADLERSRDWLAKVESERHRQQGSGILIVPIVSAAPKVDGRLDDWPATTDWASIDRRGTKANFNSNSRPYEVSGAVALSDSQLFAAWRTTEKDLLGNSGETPLALFKHGGCLDLMLATDPAAPPDRAAPVAGDERLLVTRVRGETKALLYRAKVPGTQRSRRFLQSLADHPHRLGRRRQQPGHLGLRRHGQFRDQHSAVRPGLQAESRRNLSCRHRCAAWGRRTNHAAGLLEQQSHGHHRRRPQRSRIDAQAMGQVEDRQRRGTLSRRPRRSISPRPFFPAGRFAAKRALRIPISEHSRAAATYRHDDFVNNPERGGENIAFANAWRDVLAICRTQGVAGQAHSRSLARLAAADLVDESWGGQIS